LSRVPPSRQIADALRLRINAGELGPGDRLPSERELAAEHGAARNTARQAIAILQAEGLVQAEHGRGVFVRRRPPLLRLGSDRYSRRHREGGKSPFRTEMERQGREPRVEVPEVGPAPAPPEAAARLGLEPGDQVLRRENHYYADDQPIQIGYTYFPWEAVKGSPLTQAAPGPGGIYARLEDLGHRLTRMREDVTSRMPSPEEVAALAIGPGVPVLDVWHTTINQHGDPVEVTHFVLPADRHQLAYELPID
jgi:GntR family transcriptional regulator